MNDRIPTYPGRVKMTPVDGQENVYEMQMADEAQVEGDAPVKKNLLKDTTAALYGMGNTAVVDDVLAQLALGIGKYGYKIHVQLPSGTPVKGATVSGISALSGRNLITDDNGDVIGTSTSKNPSISVNSPWFDVKSQSGVSVPSTGLITEKVITLELNEEVITVTSSKEISNWSPYAKTVDLCAVGGGAGGGAFSWGSQRAAGSAGGGGYVTNKLAVSLSGITKLSITVGTGGTGGQVVYSGMDDSEAKGGTGGTTTISNGSSVLCSANGGKGGTTYELTNANSYNGGDGNGAGGGVSNKNNGLDGTIGSQYVFNESSIGIRPGGGGGAGAVKLISSSGDISANGTPGKGAGYGGDGKVPVSQGNGNDGNPGKVPGGGGAGGSGYLDFSTDWETTSYGNGGKGGDGAAYLRFHH